MTTIQSTLVQRLYSFAEQAVLPRLPWRLRSMALALLLMGLAGALAVWLVWQAMLGTKHYFQGLLRTWYFTRICKKYPNATAVPITPRSKKHTFLIGSYFLTFQASSSKDELCNGTG